MRIVELTESTKKNLLKDLLKRSPSSYGTYEQTVSEIVNNVKENGDKAVFEYTEKFDHFALNSGNIRVTEEEIKEAYKEIPEDLIEVYRHSAANIRTFHESSSVRALSKQDRTAAFWDSVLPPLKKRVCMFPAEKPHTPAAF